MSVTTPREPKSAPTGAALAQCCGRYADEKLASEITILDLRGLSHLCDYFVLCSGNSLPHLKAIRDDVIAKLSEEHSVRPNHRDGDVESQWLVLDFIDVVLHIFQKDTRAHYALEDLWADAPRLDWQTGEVVTVEATEDAPEETAPTAEH